MRLWIAAVGGSLAVGGSAAAQAPFVSKPIDTDKLVVAPANTAAGVTGSATSGTIRTFGRTVAGLIEDNGIVRTVNNLFGRRATPTPTQAGFSPLPLPGSYTSTKYKNAFTPAVPRSSVYGTTPNVPLPVGPTTNR